MPSPGPPQRRRATAAARTASVRLVGATALAILGQFAVDMPAGYFGPGDAVTAQGLLFAGFLCLLAVAAVIGLLDGRRWGSAVASLTYSVAFGAFVPALPSDPVIAGGLVLWPLALLGRQLFPRSAVPSRPPSSPVGEWLATNGRAARHLLGVSLVATTVVVGYRIGSRVPAQAVCLALAGLALIFAAPYLLRRWRASGRPPLVEAGLLIVAATLAGRPALALTALAACQAVVLLRLLTAEPLFHDLTEHFFNRPAVLLLVSFVVLIAAGTVLLSFPVSGTGGRPIAPIDALFTATSAACVTGLVVVDTPSAFSPVGHGVILALIQAGGLNIMVLSTFAAVLLGRGLGLRGERALGSVLDLQPGRSAYPLVSFIVLSTVAVETVGAAALGLLYARHGYPPGQAAWYGVFHSVSAFCNAGFALHDDSLALFRGDPLALLVVALLITAGGLGFGVLAVVWLGLRRRRPRLGMQVQLVLAASAALVAFGTLWFAVAEWERSLAGLGVTDKLVNALFQSVTLRTAGFNSVDLGLLHPATVVMMLGWMFVGASPGGTGGGIKTTTAAVLLGAIPAMARGEERVVLFGRTIGLETVYRSAAIAAVSLLVVFVGSAVLLALAPLGLPAALFEVVSAMGTVGLSLGGTARLDALGKTLIAAVMLAGRIGPLTLALLLGREERRRVRHPEARVMVG